VVLTHCLFDDDVGLNSMVCLGLDVAGMSRSRGTVRCQYLRLATNYGQNAPVADDKDREDPGVDRSNIIIIIISLFQTHGP